LSFKVVIPARFASTRLPGKPLRFIAGRTMLEHVHRLACQAGASEVIVATDDQRIRAACDAWGARACMTRPDHQSGTDRIAEVALQLGWKAEEIVVNVQGDEPLLPPQLIVQAAQLLEKRRDADIATLAGEIGSIEDYLDPNAVKVVVAQDGRALYFSRAPVPWFREGAPAGLASQSQFHGSLRHIGLYSYRVAALQRLASSPQSSLELAEKLEQLRALELGMVIVVGMAGHKPGPGVDTEQDLARVEALLGASC